MMAVRKRPDGWWYPWIFVAGFLVVFAVNGIMLFFATSTFSGLSVEKSFEKGNAYNSEIAAHNAQQATGWNGDVRLLGSLVLPDGGRKVRWIFDLKDRTGATVQGMDVIAEVKRPAVQGYDQVIRPVATEDGYIVEMELPLKGQWEITLKANRMGDPTFRMRKRLQVP